MSLINIGLGIVLLFIGVGLWLLSRKNVIGNETLDTLDKVASIVAVLVAIILLVFPFLEDTESAQTATSPIEAFDQTTPTILPTETATTAPSETPLPPKTPTQVPPTEPPTLTLSPIPPTDTPDPPTPIPPSETPLPPKTPTQVPPTETSVPPTETFLVFEEFDEPDSSWSENPELYTVSFENSKLIVNVVNFGGHNVRTSKRWFSLSSLDCFNLYTTATVKDLVGSSTGSLGVVIEFWLPRNDGNGTDIYYFIFRVSEAPMVRFYPGRVWLHDTWGPYPSNVASGIELDTTYQLQISYNQGNVVAFINGGKISYRDWDYFYNFTETSTMGNIERIGLGAANVNAENDKMIVEFDFLRISSCTN